MTKRSRLILWLAVLLVGLGAAQLACALTSQPTATPQPIVSATDTVRPTDTAEPTATTTPPGPTPTPMPPLPPRLVDRSPERGEEGAVDAPLVLRFDQPMDRASVEAAFTIEPAVRGSFEWADDRTVLFRPAGQFDRQTRYDVTLGDAVQSAAGLKSELPFSFRFQTVGFLEVSQVLPADGAEEVDVDTTITVMFNRPVVPLVHTAQLESLPQPLSFSPLLAGSGEWINTSIFVFRPDGPMAAGTRYVATISAGLTDSTGGVLVEDYSWSFNTQAPLVTWSWPPDGQAKIGLTEPITITFNQPMDRPASEAAFRVRASDGTVPPGRLVWSEDSTTLAWQPAGLLSMATRYDWELSSGARSAAGAANLAQAASGSFWTVEYPALLFTRPGDGESRADPYGGLELYFASPMDPSTILPNLTIIPEPTSVYTWWDSWDDRFYVGFTKEASTDYVVTVGAAMADPYGNRLGKETVVRFTTDRLEPMAYLNTPGLLGTYNAYTPTVVYAVYRNVDELNLRLATVSLDQMIRLTGPESWEAWDSYVPRPDEVVREWTVPVENLLNETIIWRIPLTDPRGGLLSPGIYYLEMTAPGFDDWQRSEHLLVISRLNLTVKSAVNQQNGEALIWATDLVSGQPVGDLSVTLVDAYNNYLDRGTTDQDGVWYQLYEAYDSYPSWIYAVVGEPGDSGFSIGTSQWSEGISTWDFNVPYEDYATERIKVYLYTDRPIYRPGHTVYFKGILRDPLEARYRPPEPGSVTVEAYDWDDTLIYRQTLSVTEMGTFAGEIALDQEAKTGSYHFIVDPDGIREWVNFQVAEYRKPEFQVAVVPEEEQVVLGDTILAQVEANYFFGGPVSEARVTWAVFADDHVFPWTGPGRYSFSDPEDWYWYWWDEGFTYGYGELIAEGSGATDAAGKFTISLPAELGDRTGAQLLTVEATVEDINYQQVSNRAQVVVHPAAQYAGVYADHYVASAGEEETVNLIVVDLDQQPIPGADVTLVALEREWYNVQVKEDGQTRWEWTVVETPVYTETVAMGAAGRATVRFVPPAGGSYRLRAFTTDPAGRENRASAFLWVSGTDYVSWRMENNDRIELIADRESYRPGDVAEILIPSPYRGEVKALVTVERGRFIQSEVITLRSNSEVYRLPITAEFAPTAYVSVVLIKGIDETNPLSSFKMGLVQLNVSTEQEELVIELAPDREVFGPGETVTYDILVTDSDGLPVPTEFSLALVDLSVLSLAPDQAPPILDAFYGRRGLGVQTGIGLVVNVDRLNEQVADRAKGGGGGGEAALGVGIEVRSEFPDTAYWEAFVRTDADGRARVEIPLPDSLTTWRLSAKAISINSKVGQASTDIVVTKPLLVRPVAPRFFVVNDEARLGAVVHNNTDAALEVEVALAAEGVTLSATTPAVQTVSIPAGGRIQVNWDVTVQDVDAVGLIYTASGGGLSDATRPALTTGSDGTIPVYHYTAPDIVGTAGQLIGATSRTEGILLPPNVDTTMGSLKVELAPSLAAAMQDGLTYLEHFAYECTEQTVSRFLPNVLTYKALRDLGIEDPELEQRLPDLVSQGLQRLYNQQHYDGGWGWWYTSKSDPNVTAWVLLGLDKAVEAGFAVDRQVLVDAAGFLGDQVVAPTGSMRTWQANQQAFIVYVLAERGEMTVSRLERLYEAKDKLSHFGKAYLALAYGLLEGEGSDRLQTLLADLAGESILSATGAHWEEAEYDWWNWNTDTRSTAIILDLLARFDPLNDLAPNVVRWLMVARTAGHWETTQETAWALIGLTDWMVATGELEADYRFDAGFNGRVLVEGEATRQTIRETTELEIAVRDMLLEQVNQLAIGRSDGPGRLYYTAHLETYLPVEAVQPIGRGVIVAREYTLAACDPTQETCPQLTSVPVGEAVRVKLTVVAPHDLYYVVVEDPLPAGAEAVDQNLLTSSALEAGDGWQPAGQDYRWGYWGWWWFNQTQIRDEKVVLFAEYLPAGTYEYTYIMQASLPGAYRVMPTSAREFYFPEVFGRSDGMIFVIEP